MNFKYLVYCISFFVPFSVYAHEGDYRLIEFVQNKGQWEGAFAYKATSGNLNIFLENNAFTFLLGDAANGEKIHDPQPGGTAESRILKYHVYKMRMLGANPQPEITGSKARQHYYNYFLGNDKSKWKSNIHPELNVDYKEIYKGIDLHIASESYSIKYDFIVQPGADASVIQLQYEGADEILLKEDKIIIVTSVGEVREAAPYAYQYINGERIDVACKYKLKGNTVTYHFPKGYNHSVPLIIDPTVVFSTYTGSGADNFGYTATYDNSGNFYAGGATEGNGYPTSTGAYQLGYGGGGTCGGESGFQPDVTISKFNATGSTLLYSTYLGGGNNDQPHSMVVDANGNLIIAGRTCSNNFPTTYRAFGGGSEIFVTSLNPTGTGLNGSTYIGGSGDDGINISAVATVTNSSLKYSYGDDSRSEVILDNSGNIYVASCTRSTDFPLVNSTQGSLISTQDAVIFKLNSGISTLLWSTYFGGNGDDAAYVLALNKSQSSIYVAGGTSSSNFYTTPGTYRSSYGGSIDGFITKFQNGGGYPRQIGTYVGGGSYDQCFGIQIDANNNVYTTGQSLNNGVPLVNSPGFSAGSSQFILKLDSNLSSAPIYATQFGSGIATRTNITPTAFLVDTCENVYVSGWGGALSGNGSNTTGMPAMLGTPAPALISGSSPTGEDFYFFVMARNATAQLFGGFFGSPTKADHVDGGTSRFDKNGVIYQAICGDCDGGTKHTVPTTAGAYSTTNGSTRCNLVALKIAFNLGSVDAIASALPSTTVCLGEPINFSSAASSNATNYAWDFGDGNTSANPNPTYTYTSGGTFLVRLIASNPNACKTSDTAFLTIKVDTNSIKADFTVIQTDSCKPFNAAITNTSKAGGGATHQWSFGDGKTFTGVNPGTHEYPDTGTYTITLIINDPAACNPYDTISKTISFNTIFVKADFEAPPVICEKTKAVLNNRSSKATSFLWKFGDGKTSTDNNPEHIYDTAGSYIIMLYAYNPGSCNGVDSMSHTITVEGTPFANFKYDPIIPITNAPVNFTNLSQRATNYVWDFGDNTFSQLETPQPKYYKKTGSYRVCLQAQNLVGCSDTICKYVDADVYPLADVPKGFSPNGDGKNDILYVRGSGIETVNLKIYNRWGEMVFETNDMNIGWDGKYKGKEAPMEAYAFVLNVKFVDETTFYKKGNVTLLR